MLALITRFVCLSWASDKSQICWWKVKSTRTLLNIIKNQPPICLSCLLGITSQFYCWASYNNRKTLFHLACSSDKNKTEHVIAGSTHTVFLANLHSLLLGQVRCNHLLLLFSQTVSPTIHNEFWNLLPTLWNIREMVLHNIRPRKRGDRWYL